jgi:alkylhydroperoxidase family enzyme
MRIPFADENRDAETIAAATEIRQVRGQVRDLYRILLNSPPIASGWLALLTAVRQQCKLAGKFREIAIMRVAIINGAQFEYKSHIAFALKEGLRQDQIDAMPEWQKSNVFDATERAVLAYVDAMTNDIQVPDEVFDPLKLYFDARELTELTVTIASYNLVSRFLEAVQFDH